MSVITETASFFTKSSNTQGFKLLRPLSKGTKLLSFSVIKAIIIIYVEIAQGHTRMGAYAHSCTNGCLCRQTDTHVGYVHALGYPAPLRTGFRRQEEGGRIPVWSWCGAQPREIFLMIFCQILKKIDLERQNSWKYEISKNQKLRDRKTS